MQFIYVTDTHFTHAIPKYRTTKFLPQILKKWDEVFEIARKERVDFIMHGGDIFHNNEPNTYVVNEVMKRVDKDIPFYLAVGNHDHKGDNYESIFESSPGIGILHCGEKIKVVKDDFNLKFVRKDKKFIFHNS